MLWQILLGALVTALTVFIQAFFIAKAGDYLSKSKEWAARPPYSGKFTAILVASMVWLVLGVSLNCAIWTNVYLYVGAFDSVEPALYFSMVSFTTLGFGDITLGKQFRLLSGLTAVSGLFSFGLTSAFIIDLMASLRELRDKSNGF